MDLGRILDGIPEPSMVNDKVDFLNGAVPNASGDYVLPVPMTDYQRLLYDQVVSAHYSDILQFFETDEPVMVESLQTLYTNSQLVASHPYLLVDHYLPHNLLLKEVPERLASSSGKFKTLHDLIELTKALKINIALVSRAGKTIDLLEAFLLGKLINYKRYSGSYLRDHPEEDPEYSTVHLIPSAEFDAKHIDDSTRFDVVLAFDLSFDILEPHIYKARHQSNTLPCPIIRLVPYYSVEHIVYSLRKADPSVGKEQSEFLKRVLSAISVLRGKVGSIPTDLKPLYAHNLKYLGKWFNNTRLSWLLPDAPAIADYTALDVEKSLLTEVADDTKPPKRPEQEKDYYKAKRIRRENEVPLAPEDAFVTNDNFNVDSKDNTPYGGGLVLTHKILQKLELVLADNKLKSDELENYRLTASSRQDKLEEALEELAVKVGQTKELETRVKSAEKRVERLNIDNIAKNDKMNELKKELEESRELFSKGSPEQAQLEAQRAKIAELETAVSRAEKNLETTRSQNDYLTHEYQKASQSAAESAQRIKQIESEKVELQKRASDEAARLRLLTFDEERAAKDTKINELRLKLQLVEEHLIRVLDAEKQQPTSRSRYARGNSRTKSPATVISRIGSPSVSDGR